METNYKLYVHINKTNGKRYYGITKQKAERRWRNGYGYKKNQYFYRAIKKCTWDGFDHIILHENLTESEAKELEQYFIAWYDTTNYEYGYNITLGGEGHSGAIMSEESRKKMSDSRKGIPKTKEHKQKISEAHKGKKLSEETKQKLSEINKGENHPMYGKHHTEEAKQKISEAQKGKHHTEEAKQKMSEAQKGKKNHGARSVICITTKRVFFTAKEGACFYNTDSSTITKCCKGKKKSCGKHNGQKLVWRYLNYKHNKTYRIEERTF